MHLSFYNFRTKCIPRVIFTEFKSPSTANFHLMSISRVQVRSRSFLVSQNPTMETFASNPRDLFCVASVIDEGIETLRQKYAKRFQRALPLPAGTSDARRAFAQAITSNLVGGIGYFYGDSVVDPGFSREWDEDESADDEEKKTGPYLTEPRGLLTATPSRSFFPRGFYW